MKLKLLGVLFAFCSLTAGTANAAPASESLRSQVDELKRLVTQLSDTVRIQQARIEVLESGHAASTATVSAPQTRTYASSVPDIGVVADIVGTTSKSKSDDGGNDRLSAREVELVFGHEIDPYARMDVVATFSDQEDPDIEEANVTYGGLPWGIKARIGKMRQRIGKASAAHRDSLETVNDPFVVQRYFGEEGLSRTGLELSAFTPLSLDTYTQELVLGMMEGGSNEGELFGNERRHPTLYGHLANFLELGDSSSLEIGGTALVGSNTDEDSSFDTRVFGIDATLSHFVTPNNKLKLQSEFYFVRANPGNVDSGPEARESPYGFYTLADYRFAPRWGGGFRYDYVQPTSTAVEDRIAEQSYAAYLTFFESEFARWRLQYERVAQVDRNEDNRFYLQGTFAIGAHKHNLN